MNLTALLHSAAARGAITGLVSAAAVDLHAFLKFNSWKDVAAYNWSTASFRWAIGLVSGVLTGAGYGALIR